jgi:hypothetical protein
MVKTYGLNEEQATKLLELNKQYAGKMGPRFGRRGGRPERGERPDSMKRAERPDSMKHGQRPPRPEGRGNFEGMRKTMDAYEAELKQIMTEEQFKAYTADRQKQFQNGRRRPNGQNMPARPHRD